MCAPLFAVCVTVKPDRLELTAPTRRNLKRDRGMGTSSCLIGDQGTLFNPAFSLSLVIFVSMHFFLLLLAVKFIINSGLTVSNYEFDRHRFHRQVASRERCNFIVTNRREFERRCFKERSNERRYCGYFSFGRYETTSSNSRNE